MTSTLVQIFTDPIPLSLITVAVVTATYAAYRANDTLRKSLDPVYQRHPPSLSETIADRESRFLETTTAVAIPVIATISIIFLFFFLHSISFVLTLFSCVAGFFSVLFTLWPGAEFLVRRLRAVGIQLPTSGTAESILLVPVCVFVILAWLFTGHWLANNVIGISLCVLFASLCKVPNLKAAVMVFVGLFIYDIFFVFFSERFFGSNVMVEVATSEPTNPAYSIANYLGLPFKPVQNLALPAKLIFQTQESQAILGMGDIIIPSILMVYLVEIDMRESRQTLRDSYIARAVVAYVVGLTASLFFNIRYGIAQPAMLYIVPALLAPTLWTGYRRKEISLLWSGPNRAGIQGVVENCSRSNTMPNSLETGVSRRDYGGEKNDETTCLVP